MLGLCKAQISTESTIIFWGYPQNQCHSSFGFNPFVMHVKVCFTSDLTSLDVINCIADSWHVRLDLWMHTEKAWVESRQHGQAKSIVDTVFFLIHYWMISWRQTCVVNLILFFDSSLPTVYLSYHTLLLFFIRRRLRSGLARDLSQNVTLVVLEWGLSYLL